MEWSRIQNMQKNLISGLILKNLQIIFFNTN
jgi:hypothetical protein